MKFNYDIYSETFQCSEINLKLYKNLLKSLYGEEPDPNLFLDELFETFACISNKPKTFFQSLSYEQIFLLLLQLRTNTFGDSCQIVIKNENEENQNIFLNLDNIKTDVMGAIELMCQPIVVDDILVNLKPPLLNHYNATDLILNCVNSCVLLKENVKLEITTLEEAKQLIETLSPKVVVQISNAYKRFVQEIENLNFLEFVKDKNYFLGLSQPFDQSIVWYAKLFFSENLSTLYENIFYLAKYANFTPSYLENECSPGEYIFFVKKLSAILSEQNAQNSVE